MAEHPHALLVRRAYDAFFRRDWTDLAGVLASDATHHAPGNNAMSGDYKGRDAMLEFYQRRLGETDGTMRVELMSVCVDGRGYAVSVHRLTAQRKGRTLDNTGSIIFRISGDRATDLYECVQDIDRENAFWS